MDEKGITIHRVSSVELSNIPAGLLALSVLFTTGTVVLSVAPSDQYLESSSLCLYLSSQFVDASRVVVDDLNSPIATVTEVVFPIPIETTWPCLEMAESAPEAPKAAETTPDEPENGSGTLPAPVSTPPPVSQTTAQSQQPYSLPQIQSSPQISPKRPTVDSSLAPKGTAGVLHSPIPHKVLAQVVHPLNASDTPTSSRSVSNIASNRKIAPDSHTPSNPIIGTVNASTAAAGGSTVFSSTARPRKASVGPSLVVKQDTTLKSCLSPPSDSMSDHHAENPRESISLSDNHHHPSFLIKSDNISPNKHGLLSLNQTGTATPVNDEEHAHSHINFTPIVNGASGSALSVPVSPPRHTSKSPPGSGPVSRMNSLRYSEQDEKKLIESLRISNNSSLASDDNRSKSKTTEPLAKEGVSDQEDSSEGTKRDKLHLLIGITGCISIHKNIFLIIDKLFELYTHDKLEIQVVLTKSAEWFLSEKLYKFEELQVKVWFSDDDVKHFLTSPYHKNVALYNSQASMHVRPMITQKLLSQYSLVYDLQRWTDVFLIAPLSANTMAKLITGLADDLLSNLAHIWPVPQLASQQQQVPPGKTAPAPNCTILTNNLVSPKPIIAALALTNSMYSHPITKKQLVMLQESYPNMSILKPVEKCVDVDGNISMGGMRSWREVVDFVSKKLGEPPEDEDEYDDDDDDEEEEEEEEDEEEKIVNGKDAEEKDEEIVKGKEDYESPSLQKSVNSTKKEQEPTTTKVKYLPTVEPKPKIGEEKLEVHEDVGLQPIISNAEEKKMLANGSSTDLHRHRRNTISRRELQEHEKLATQNAILNSCIGVVASPVPSHFN
ncbi:Halotolerance protein HAL3 [Scheffersomyces xylosifermentans]|uniref:Halotolerance protein HAL3 n=1 Tax=Scheffersomyces xylosifermentans TaxID=1304137 RepID=UPI00315C76E2